MWTFDPITITPLAVPSGPPPATLPPIVDLVQSIVDLLNTQPWKDGLTAERTYQRDVELKDLDKILYVYPVREEYNREERDRDNLNRIVGITIAVRPPTTSNDDVDPWAKEFVDIRDFLIANDPAGWDNYTWDPPEGELLDSDRLRTGVCAMYLEITYRIKD